jgi:hypothetical protein
MTERIRIIAFGRASSSENRQFAAICLLIRCALVMEGFARCGAVLLVLLLYLLLALSVLRLWWGGAPVSCSGRTRMNTTQEILPKRNIKISSCPGTIETRNDCRACRADILQIRANLA